ncbi:MAG: type II secretion system protein, partial [Campylobacter sp.]
MKKGFTLIELIFTIVILAITTMAIPRIVAQTTELNALAIKEELVYNAKAFMSRISKA